MKTIAQTYIDEGLKLGREQARQEMQQEIKKAYEEAQRAQQETQKARQKAQQEAQKVRQEAQAKERQGLLSEVEWGLELKFGKEGLGLFNEVQQIQEMSLLSAIRAALKFVSDLGELRSIYQPALASN